MENIQETITDESLRKRQAFLRLVRKSVLFAMPFWALIALYVYDDPFMVLRKYEVYDSDVMLNEQQVGWQIYRNHKDSVHFNSFILGNSCAMAFRCGEWEKYLAPGDRAIRLFGNAESMKPSARGELEITDLNRIYLEDGSLNVELLGQGFTWLDTGTHESLVDATNFVKTVEQHQHRKIACLEEIAYLNGWISKDELMEVYEVMKKNQYGQYLKDVLDGKYIDVLHS